ncbi:response regulator transcription factor [Neobacillus sp. MM2021_6]|uniref:response regulator transcription factor n=1 Tax=Bacillaceae TaxID=186817 RepID=UPI00140E7469|nr:MULTISPECIES: response regulator transcription factor [Bacillaceae]MBO0962547.1 response regulator transcription factor [Neobacillus sp. MM2021_6]NHC17109.1 response regulator transcription factor [Bacillus sp. MM2020_4]
MNQILLVEDEQSVLGVIKAYLEKAGYLVRSADTGLKGIDLFMAERFDLVILDLMLPDISGEEVCKIVRQTSDVHIFMLTAKGSLNDRIEGLRIGADEYLIKPFSPRELIARVNALFRRLNGRVHSSSVIFDDGNLLIDCAKRTIKVSGAEKSFTPNEFDILRTLVANKGKVLSRDQLIDTLYGEEFNGFDRTIDVHIKNIRKKIEKDTKNPKYIVTVLKAGYKFGGVC